MGYVVVNDYASISHEYDVVITKYILLWTSLHRIYLA
jgi:hypothetical protein